jgi:hypothetical protein
MKTNVRVLQVRKMEQLHEQDLCPVREVKSEMSRTGLLQ